VQDKIFLSSSGPNLPEAFISPKGIISSAFLCNAQRKDIFGTLFAPKHAGLFATFAHRGFTAGFDNARSDTPTTTPSVHSAVKTAS
jgi:hypothetical protein